MQLLKNIHLIDEPLKKWAISFQKGAQFWKFCILRMYMKFYFSSNFEVLNWLCWELLVISRHFPLSFTVSEKNSTEICQEVANSPNLMHCWGLLLLYFCKMFIFMIYLWVNEEKWFAKKKNNRKEAQIPKLFMLRKVYIYTIDFDVFFLEMIVKRA